MTTSFEERVCDEVRKYRHLYDRSVRDYTDGQMANNSWKEIAQTLASDEKHVRKTWKSMRDRYVKAKRKGRHGDHRAGRGKWILTSLSWLNNYVKHGELADVKEMVEERDSSAELPSTPLSQAVETLVRQLGPPTSKGKGVKRKVEQEFLDYQQPPSLDHDEQALRAIANKSLDEDEHFVLSLVPALKRLAPYKKANVKIEIMRMITQAEFEDYHQD